jgi:putative oxidoreductase
MKIGRLATRLLVGGLFVGHGMQKLTGDFDGPGLEGTTQMMEKLELEPAKPHAYLVGATETVGGALFALGAATPLAASALIGSMVTAIRKVHGPNGPWVTDGGYEYNLVLIAAFAALTDAGPGKPSVDAARFPRLRGKLLALASVAAGVAGSYLVTEVFSDSEPAPQEGASELAADPASATDQDTARTDEGRFAPQTQTSDVTSPAS